MKGSPEGKFDGDDKNLSFKKSTIVKNQKSVPIFIFSATIKIDASLAGDVTGKDWMNFRLLGQLMTGVKVDLRDYKSDPNLKIVKLKAGMIDEIKQGSQMVSDLIRSVTYFSTSTSTSKNA